MSQSNQFLAIAQVCKILSAAAATREESESFANFASKWDEYAAENAAHLEPAPR
jgi:hypothetical protein